MIGFQFVVTLYGFVIFSLGCSRFYRPEQHRDASLYPRFVLDTFVAMYDCDGVNWQDSWTILESGTSDLLIWIVREAQNDSITVVQIPCLHPRNAFFLL